MSEQDVNKIIAREVEPERIDFSSYFDGDGLTNKGGDNCAVYIISHDRNRLIGFNIEEYKEILDQVSCIIDDYDGGKGIGNKNYQYKSLTKLLEANRVNPRNTRIVAQFKKWLEYANGDISDIAEFLTLTTGEPWETKSFYGYSQGDYCEVLYCTNHYTQEHIKEIGRMWLGCGTEFCINDCYGYFAIDELRWEEGEKLRKYLADCYGCKPEELEVHLYIGSHTVADYKIM